MSRQSLLDTVTDLPFVPEAGPPPWRLSEAIGWTSAAAATVGGFWLGGFALLQLVCGETSMDPRWLGGLVGVVGYSWGRGNGAPHRGPASRDIGWTAAVAATAGGLWLGALGLCTVAWGPIDFDVQALGGRLTAMELFAAIGVAYGSV